MHVALLGDFPEDLDRPGGGVEGVAACLADGLVRSGVELSILRYAAPARGEPLRLKVANRYDFTNLSELKIEWAIGGESGIASGEHSNISGTHARILRDQ